MGLAIPPSRQNARKEFYNSIWWQFCCCLAILFCLVPCDRLRWLLDSFWAHVNIVHRIVSYHICLVLSRWDDNQWILTHSPSTASKKPIYKVTHIHTSNELVTFKLKKRGTNNRLDTTHARQ